MSRHLQFEVEKLKKKMFALMAKVEDCVQKALKSISDRDWKLAQEVIDADSEIDNAEVEIEEDCLKLLALHQPVATDLRFIIAVLKINNDIERVGDHGVNIAERAQDLCGKEPMEVPFDLTGMGAKALSLLGQSLDSLMKMDAASARKVLSGDREVDAIYRDMFDQVAKAVRKNPDYIDRLLNYLSAGRQLERIADYATNISEDVIYLVEGQIARHRHKKQRGDSCPGASS